VNPVTLGAPWRIYYAHGFIDGVSEQEWLSAPAYGVQIVVLFRTPAQELGERRWIGVKDRLLWTGVDEYDPFGWGAKTGTLISDAEYARICHEAMTCLS
jgi:hypothetical protein